MRSKSSLRRTRVGGPLIILALPLLVGCATAERPAIYIEPEAASKSYAALVLAEVKTNSGVEIPAELLERTANRLTTKLGETGFSVTAAKPTAKEESFLVLDATIQRYEAGSVAGRWIGFGQGAALCALEVEMIDGQSGRKVGDVAVTRTIEGGGLFSIGAGDYVVDRCADSIADGIAEELSKARAGG